MSNRTPVSPFTYAEVAALEGVSERTITRRVSLGQLEAVRIDGRVRITQAAIDRYHAGKDQDAEAIARRRHIVNLVRKAPPLTADQAARITQVLKASA